MSRFRAVDAAITKPVNDFVWRPDCGYGMIDYYAAEMTSSTVGPIPAKLFLSDLLPYNHEFRAASSVLVDEHRESQYSLVRHSAHRESDKIRNLCDELNRDCKGFKFVATEKNTENPSAIYPPICFYRDDVSDQFKVENDLYVSDPGFAELFVEENKDVHSDPFHTLFQDNSATFVKSRISKERQKQFNILLSHFLYYAKSLFSRQHRTHCFFIAIFGNTARLFRWDRAGAIVSEAFKFRETPWLSEFVRRYCQATDAQRGYDTSVCKATADEEKIFSEKIRQHVMELYAPEDEKAVDEYVTKHYQEGKVFRIKVWPQQPKDLGDPHDIPETQIPEEVETPDDISISEKELLEEFGVVNDSVDNVDDAEEANLALESMEETPATTDGAKDNMKKRLSACRQYADAGRHQFFLVSQSVTEPRYPVGRSTRGYWSVKKPDEKAGDDPDDYRICFLKDTWRIETNDVEREGDIVVELVEAGVEHVSDILCHSDVGLSEDGISGNLNHKTRTNEYFDADWFSTREKYRRRKQSHYRMVSVEVGCPLRELLGTYELLQATRMAFIAILQALTKCFRLHCDISDDNILIMRKGGEFKSGTLIDWEFGCRVKGKEKARLYKRCGTWAFMSYDILIKNSKHKHSLHDDMGSLYYVVLYSGLRWLPHNELADLGGEMNEYFFHCLKNGEESEGGIEKCADLLHGRFVKRFKWEDESIRLWLSHAWYLRNRGKKVWTPKRFLKVWTDALELDPPKLNRYEHVVEPPPMASESESSERFIRLPHRHLMYM